MWTCGSYKTWQTVPDISEDLRSVAFIGCDLNLHYRIGMVTRKNLGVAQVFLSRLVWENGHIQLLNSPSGRDASLDI